MAQQDEDTERSQDPTRKRLDDALERGDVVKSQEVNTWFVIAGATLLLMSFSGGMASALATTLRGLIANAHVIRLEGLIPLVGRIAVELIAATGLPLLVLALAAAAGNLIQHRPAWSTALLHPKLARISPLAGAKRLFSMQALAGFIKGLVKLALVGAAMAALLWPQRHRLPGMAASDVAMILPATRSMALELLGAVVALLAVLAAADYLFQYRQWFERQKMSVRELKEEYKQTEGDPAIKGKIRQLRHLRMRKRMMAAVPQASVVITNPTHFAIALRYERGMNAPVCLAKGIDVLALKIREIAGKHRIPIVENPPLARALHAAVEVDQEIPPEHYQAVAEVIGYVMRINRRAFAR